MPNPLSGIATWFLLQGIAFLSVGYAASPSETLTIGYSSFSGHYVPLWIAVDDRLGKKYGLDLKAVYAGRARPQQLLISGEAPLVFTQSPFGISVPPQGRLALRLQGAGEIGNIAGLLPLGEDTITGHFTLDGGVTGTLAAPAASGHLTITDGRYANFATGAVLTHLRVDVSGERSRTIPNSIIRYGHGWPQVFEDSGARIGCRAR